MALKIKHNGIDISGKLELSKCLLCDRYGGMLDDITLEFPDDTNSITINRYDTLEVITDSYKSGIMYIDECLGFSGKFTVKAISSKPNNKDKKTRVWSHIRLTQIANDVAATCGLTLKTYGINDYTYDSVTQLHETDLEFLARICKREGYSIKCDNGNLIIFNERFIENDFEAMTINKSDVSPNWNFKRSANGMSRFTVRYFDMDKNVLIKFTAEDAQVDGRGDEAVMYVRDIAEAERFAHGFLRAANKECLTGMLSMTLNSGLSAGTVIDLKGFDEFDGRYVIYELTHDVLNERTSFKVRNTLAY